MLFASGRRKLTAALLLLGAVVSGGCGRTAEPAEETERTEADGGQEMIPGWQQHQEEPVVLDWYVNFSWFSTTWGDNLVSDTITEETGVSINFLTPIGSESEKLNALVASDSLPDIITLEWHDVQVEEMIHKDMVYALNELADEYDMYFWETVDPRILEWNTRADGNVYYLPNSFYLPADYDRHDNIASNQNFIVRRDIYEAIGAPDMTTPEGFMAAVRQAYLMFPEVSGLPLIPVGSSEFMEKGCNSFDAYLQNFLAVPYESEGRYHDRYTDPEYIRWLKVFRELAQEGYLRPEIFVNQRTQIEENLEAGRYFCMLYQWTDMEYQQKKLYEKNPESIYAAVDGPRNSQGDDYVLPGAGGINGWTVTLISRNCKDPERAIQLLSYLMSEHGQKLTYLGVEGETYDMADGRPVMKEAVRRLLHSDRIAYNRLYGADNAYWMLQNNVMILQWKQKPAEPMGQLEEWTYPYVRYLGQYEIKYDINTDAGNAGIEIQHLWGQTLPQLLMAESEEEFDRILEEFVCRREQLGYELVMDESSRQMTENKKKLGIE